MGSGNHSVLQSVGRSVVRPICFSSFNDIRRASAKCHGTKKRRGRGGLTDDEPSWAGPGRAGPAGLTHARRREETSLWRLPGKPSDDRKNGAIRGDVEKRPNSERLRRERRRCGLEEMGLRLAGSSLRGLSVASTTVSWR